MYHGTVIVLVCCPPQIEIVPTHISAPIVRSVIDGSGTEGDIEIRVFQGEGSNEVVVGETVVPLQKLPAGGFERKT